MRADPRTDTTLLSALSRVAPGTALRAGMDDIIRAELGALLVIGDPNALSFLYSGGIGSLADLEALRDLRLVNLAGVISGKALYEGRFGVAEGQAALEV